MDKEEIEIILILRGVPQNIALLMATNWDGTMGLSWHNTHIHNLIESAFLWGGAREGWDYWENVYSFYYAQVYPELAGRERFI